MARRERYPEDSVQDLLGFTPDGARGFWERQERGAALERGALIWLFVPHVAIPPLELIPTGDGEVAGSGHEAAEVRIEGFRLSARHTGAPPVAALPDAGADRLQVRRGRVRPGVVVSHLHGYPPQPSEALRWITAPIVLVAPLHPVTTWPKDLVDSVRRAQHPQFIWERAPVDAAEGGEYSEGCVIRLDALVPVHRGAREQTRLTGFRLAADAMALVDEWLSWSMGGTLPEDGDLHAAHVTLRELFGDDEGRT